MNYPTRKEFFNAFGILTINEIKDGLLDRTENSRNKYDEIVKDFIKHLNLDDVRPDVDTETQDRFLNYGDKELIPFTDREIKLFEFDYGDDKKPLFDFIIMEDNGATIKQTKVFCKWQNDTEEFVKLAFRTFKFREACKIVISQLMEQSKQPEAVKTDEVLKNPHETIFKNDFAFMLFDKMKGYYSDTHTPQADYSFLFDIMQKEGFVICTGAKFIDFLKDFDISITKIDSAKTGNKRKTTLYNATKENLQKKHGLSTM